MSKHTITRIPQDILHLFRIYELSSNLIIPFKNDNVKNYLKKSDTQYNFFRKYKLINQQANENESFINPKDFAPLIGQLIQPIFKGDSLNLNKLENYKTNEIFNDKFKTVSEFDTEPIFEELNSAIISNSNLSTKNFTDFQASILTTLATFFHPYNKLPNNIRYSNIFNWYRKLIKTTPIIIFFKEKHKLFSDSSLAQINKPLNDLNRDLNELTRLKFLDNKNFESGDDKLIRNYHLTDLSTSDILSLAIKSEALMDNNGDDLSNLTKNHWRQINQTNDSLCDLLIKEQSIDILDEFNQIIDLRETKNGNLNEIITRYPIHEMRNELNEGLTYIKDLLPYDLAYSTFHILSIELPIIEENHEQLLNLLEKKKHLDNFEIISVRLSLDNELINDFFQSDLINQTGVKVKESGGNYEELLKSVELKNDQSDNDTIAAMTKSSDNINSFIKKLGQLGLTTVDEGCNKNCLYLFPDKK